MGLKITEATKRFGDITAVNRISFEADKPGVFGLLGTNGAGKTTTIRMILGILKPDEGEITWNGRKIDRQRLRFGYLPEERGLYPKTKVIDQLVYFARLKGMNRSDASDAAVKWLSRLEASEYRDRIAEQLSKGNQQKIQLITSLINSPKLLILDEPFNGLDPVNTDLFKSVIYEEIDKGATIIMSSHQMSTVEEFCEDIVLLKDGATILSGNLRKIKKGYGRTNLFLSCGADISDIAKEEGLLQKRATPAGSEYRIEKEEQAYNLLKRLIFENIAIDRFELREPSLHEIFVEKAGEKQ